MTTEENGDVFLPPSGDLDQLLRHQQALLRGVALASQRLFELSDFDTAIQEALSLLGETAAVDRVFIFESHPHLPSGMPAVSYRYEWVSQWLAPEIDKTLLQNLPWDQWQLDAWYRALLAGQVITDMTPLLRQFAHRPEAPIHQIKSLLIVPIPARQGLWGCIGFDDRRVQRQWSDDEIGILRIMAASIGAAIDRQRGEARLRHDQAIASTLQQVGAVLTSTLKLDEVLDRLLKQVGRVIPYDSANVMLIDGDWATMVHHIASKDYAYSSDLLKNFKLSIAQTPILRIMTSTHQPYASTVTDTDPNWLLIPETGWWIRSWLGVPIISHGRMIGLYSLDSARAGFYSPAHYETARLYAQQAAIAIRNATLFEEIRALEQTKSEMIRIASHDLRTPLTRIRSLAQKCAAEADTPLNARQQGYLDMISAAVQDIEHILTEILSLERIEARYQHAEPIDWPILVERSVRAVQSVVDAKSHTLSLHCEADLPVIRGDPARLERALVNLLDNAAKHCPPGTLIELRAVRRTYGDALTVAVEVQDNGPGIAPELQAWLFEPSYRGVREPGGEEIERTGQGLAVVKAAVEYHKGRVYVDSAPGEGCLFGFWIPA